jgi:hypothetical protein
MRLGVAIALLSGAWATTSMVAIADASPSPSLASPSPVSSPSPLSSPSPAAAHITLNPSSGTPGTPVTVRGSGFPSSSRVDIYVDVPAQNLYLFASAEVSGLFAFVAPINASVGLHRVCANSYATSASPEVVACTQFLVTDFQPRIAVFPASGHYSERFTVAGSGFPRGELVALYWDAPVGFLDTPGPFADNQGGFGDQSMVAADLRAGIHNICADTGAAAGVNQPYAVKLCVSFTVLADASPAPVSPGPVSTVSPSPVDAPSPDPSPAPIIDPTPIAASGPSFPWPLASGIAAALALGLGYFIGTRRQY